MAQAYFTLRLADQQIASIGQEIEIRRRDVALVSHRADVGLVPRVDAVAATHALTAALRGWSRCAPTARSPPTCSRC